jgi:hypothetical protein
MRRKCAICKGRFKKREGWGFAWKWTCNSCRSRLAAEKRAAERNQPPS